MADLGITPSQAHYVLSSMLSDKRVSRKEVADYLGRMQKEISDLEQRLDELRSLTAGSGGRTAPRAARGRAGRRAAKPAAAAPKAKVKAKITPEQRASRKLQGVYMSLLRRIPKGKRAQYQTLAKEKNRQAAVDAMKAALKI